MSNSYTGLNCALVTRALGVPLSDQRAAIQVPPPPSCPPCCYSGAPPELPPYVLLF